MKIEWEMLFFSKNLEMRGDLFLLAFGAKMIALLTFKGERLAS